MKRKLRNVVIADLLFYFIGALLILIVHPSFDNYLSSRTIILQCGLACILILGSRFVIGVYSKNNNRINDIVNYGRLFLADIISLGVNVILQHLLFYKDRIELVTMLLIVLWTFISSSTLRFIFYIIDIKSIALTETIPFSPPDISELEIKEVEAALRSGWITTGPRTKKLEKQIAGYIGVNRCACLNSQTAAAEMSLRILGIGPGDEVITCAYTYTATASVIAHMGADIVFVDCSNDIGSIEMDYDALENAITNKTKVIIPIDIAGIPCNYDKIFEIVERKKTLFSPNNNIQKAIGRIIVVADAAHALGAEYHGKKVGSVADFTNFSFHAVKNFTTGEGGAMAWRTIDGIDDEQIYRQVQLYSLHGQSKDAFAKTQKGGWEYDVIGTWYKCNMTDVAAAIGLAQLERYPALLAKRKKIIEKYDNELRSIGIETLIHYNSEHISSGHLYLTRIPGITPEKRNEIIVKMAERNISCNVHYKPLPMLTAYKNMGFDIRNYPNAYEKFANEITLPLYTTLTNEMVDYIIRQYVDIVKNYIC